MAITTMDGVVAALPGQIEPYVKNALAGTFVAGDAVSLFTATGNPTLGAKVGSLTGVVPTSATAGAINFTNPGSGNSYIGRGTFGANIAGTLVLYDRLAHNSAISGTTTTAQAATTPALTRPDANGASVEAWLEWYTATGATPTTFSMSYTNQSGTSGKTSGNATIRANALAGLMVPIPLASGDTGVRVVATGTVLASTGTAGDMGITLLRRLAEIPCLLANVATALDVFSVGMAQIFNSACICAMFITSTTSAPIVMGSMNIIQG